MLISGRILNILKQVTWPNRKLWQTPIKCEPKSWVQPVNKLDILLCTSKETALLVVHAVFFMRFLAYRFFTVWVSSPWITCPIDLAHGVTFGLMWAASASTANAIAPSGMSATLQVTHQMDSFEPETIPTRNMWEYLFGKIPPTSFQNRRNSDIESFFLIHFSLNFQGIVGALYYNLGRGTGTLIGGYIQNEIGGRQTFFYLSFVALTTGIVYIVFILSRRNTGNAETEIVETGSETKKTSCAWADNWEGWQGPDMYKKHDPIWSTCHKTN